MRSSGEADPSVTSLLFAEGNHAFLRLFVIPLLLYVVWVLETYLLEGSIGLFSHFRPLPFVLYAVFANCIMGIILPVLLLRSAFRSGAVNMFQIGFRSLRRTVLFSSLTALSGYLYLVTFTPFGTRRTALVGMFLFILPLAVAEVVTCWVLVGTHVQAYLRKGGAAASITVGVVVTAFLFAISFAAHSPPLNQSDFLLTTGIIGAAAALFFFAVRDVYASVIFVACATLPVMLSAVDPVIAAQSVPSVYGAAALSLASLVCCHLYLFWNFRTIRIPMQTSGLP
jgi:hypothetical protein